MKLRMKLRMNHYNFGNMISNNWYQTEDAKYGLDYDLISPDIKLRGGRQFWHRGPALNPANKNYITCIGSAHTFGRFTQRPYPLLLGEKLGFETLNLGTGGAGPAFFSSHERFIELINKSAIVIIQIMSARSTDTSLWVSDCGAVWGRRASDNCPTLSPNYVWEMLYNPPLIRQYIKETREKYVSDFVTLLNEIKPPTILLWFSKRTPDYRILYPGIEKAPELSLQLRHPTADLLISKHPEINRDKKNVMGIFPHLVNRQVVDKIKEHATEYVECVSSKGLPQHVNGNNGNSCKNTYYPSQAMHNKATAALMKPCRGCLKNLSRKKIFSLHMYRRNRQAGTKILISAHERSGSTTLLKIFSAHRDIKMPLFEPFNFKQKKRIIEKFGGKNKAAATVFDNDSQFDRYLDYLLSNYDGFKHLWYQLEPEYNKRLLLRRENQKIIFLWRKNILQAALSNLVAKKTEVYHKTLKNIEAIRRMRYDNLKIEKAEVEIECNTRKREIEYYRAVLKKYNADHVEVCYEDILGMDKIEDEKIAKLNEIFNFLGKKPISLKNRRVKSLLDPNKNRLLNENIYKAIPGISEIEKLGCEAYGYLFNK